MEARLVSNYPPGVTGREPEIAGLGEGVAKVECGKPATFGIKDETGKMWQVDADVCPWEGEVDAQYGGTRSTPIRYWSCPLCNGEHEDELSDD